MHRVETTEPRMRGNGGDARSLMPHTPFLELRVSGNEMRMHVSTSCLGSGEKDTCFSIAYMRCIEGIEQGTIASMRCIEDIEQGTMLCERAHVVLNVPASPRLFLKPEA